ncbi:unnamed protein product [Prorocentrum cordatum]|uniref:Uncharacterized protein n=1 Tax=Prorocentrum cordatum TaxID=2364126 RepID=A0ABN9QQM3_9DINO|nr:unnamed protein product [Polarella glacialis]
METQLCEAAATCAQTVPAPVLPWLPHSSGAGPRSRRQGGWGNRLRLPGALRLPRVRRIPRAQRATTRWPNAQADVVQRSGGRPCSIRTHDAVPQRRGSAAEQQRFARGRPLGLAAGFDDATASPTPST